MAFKNPLGKFKVKRPAYAQPTGARPQVNVRQDKPATSIPKPPAGQGSNQGAGGQGAVIQPPMGPDESYKDSLYNASKSNIQTGLASLQGYLLNNQNALGLEYGIESDRDPNDPLQASNFRISDNVDVTNPFSRAALLKRAHTQNVRGNTNSYAARGQLYAGSLQNAQNSEQFAFQGGQDSLLKDFAGRYGDTYRKWQEAQTAAGKEDLDAIAAAQERHKTDPAVGAGFNTGGAAAPGANPNQYADSGVGGKQPKEQTTKAVKDYIAKQKKTTAKKAKKPKYGSTGGAKAPGG